MSATDQITEREALDADEVERALPGRPFMRLPRLATLPTAAVRSSSQTVRVAPTLPIGEAQAAQRLSNGNIRFVAHTASPIPYASQTTAVSCASLQPVVRSEVK